MCIDSVDLLLGYYRVLEYKLHLSFFDVPSFGSESEAFGAFVVEYGSSLALVGVFGAKYALPVLLAPFTYEVKAFSEVVVLHL